MSKNRIVAALVVSPAVGACSNIDEAIPPEGGDTVIGSGNVVSEDRPVSGFDRIALGGFGDVVVTLGETDSLTVETDDNILPYITTEVRGGTLLLELVEEARSTRFEPSQGVRFLVTTRSLRALELDGAGNFHVPEVEADPFDVTVRGLGDVTLEAIAAEALRVDVLGQGNIEVAGEVDRLEIHIGGLGELQAGDLRAQSVQATITGMGNATVWAVDTLDVRISGTGYVNYHGTFVDVRQEVNGTGGVVALGAK